MANDFAAVDFETANSDLASICQAGIVVFRDGEISDEWSSLVNPEDYFDPWNVRIHGIDETTVAGAPTFARVVDAIDGRLSGQTAVCHTHFDRAALARACERHGVPLPTCRWLDSATLARWTWVQFLRSGYGLASVCAHLGISFRHHDALEDARAAGQIVIKAMTETGLDLDGLLTRLREPAGRFAQDGNAEGLFCGEMVVFTGSLAVPRRDAAALAAAAGCDVADTVGETTTLLVVGDQDLRKLAGHEKSSKHRKAEQRRAAGQSLRIIGESDFFAMMKQAGVGWSLDKEPR